MNSRKQWKKEALVAMGNVRPSPYWISLLYLVIGLLLSVLTMRLNGTFDAYRTMFESAMQGETVYAEPHAMGGFIGWILTVALDLMSMVMEVGFMLYAQRVARHIHASAGDLFDVFGMFFRAILIQVLPSLLISLMAMLYVLPVTVLMAMTGQLFWIIVATPLLIPAIRAYYSYRQAVYIMLDHPDMGCYQCIAASKAMMAGHRWELFKLDFSFLGWGLLCMIPVAGQILMVWLNAYMQVTYARYYDAIAPVSPWQSPGPGGM